MRDPILFDSRLSGTILLAGTLVTLICAAVGLTSWPGQQLFKALFSLEGKAIFSALSGYALIFNVMFWSTRPTKQEQWLVIAIWAGLVAWLGADELQDATWKKLLTYPIETHLATALAIPCIGMLVWRIIKIDENSGDYALRLRWLFVLSILFMLEPMSALDLTAALHPHVFDTYAFHFDHAAGLGLASTLINWADAIPGFPQLIGNAYGLTPLGFLAVAIIQLKGRSPHVASALLVWVGMTTLALVAYNALPIVGPRYIFGYPEFANVSTNPKSIPIAMALVPPFPRNGVPSMHFGWMLAASILWWQSGTKPWSRALIIATTVCTALATVYRGEHYVVDLVIAVPFVLGSLGLFSTGISWRSKFRQRVVIAGFGAWLVWILMLRNQIGLLVEFAWVAKLLVFSTFIVVAWQWHMLSRFKTEPKTTVSEVTAENHTNRRIMRKFGFMFFASGIAALVYQVLFAKELALVFGSTATATFTVLATFLGGMAIGSFAGGFIAHRVRRPLVAYALIEAGIGVYCIATPSLFLGMQNLYVYMAGDIAPESSSLLVLRVILGAGVLLFPTILMGATLPLLARELEKVDRGMGAHIAWLYFANTAGAALGALLSAYFVIPSLGVRGTTMIAALINLLVALAALELAKTSVQAMSASLTSNRQVHQVDKSIPNSNLLMAMLSLGVVGILSLGLEVVYVHLLSIVAGNSVYAFGLMVASFLVGLSFGGELGRRLILNRWVESIHALPYVLLGLASCVAVTTMLWNGIPEYFASYANYPRANTFAAREAIRGIVCSLIMIPPTLFIGMAYTLAMDVVTSSNAKPKTILLGIGGAVNTSGNILGVLLFGFLLLPSIGGLGASTVIAYVTLGLAVLIFITVNNNVINRWLPSSLVVAILIVFTSRAALNYDQLSSGSNVYFYPQSWGKVIDHAESIDGGLTSVALQESEDRAILTLLTNGKFQGNDAMQGEMQAQIGFALAPLIHTEKRDQALIIGYGTGATSRVFHDAGFRSIDIAELSADVVVMADRYFGEVNNGVSKADGVQLHVTDGRNYLLLTNKKYDLISMEISSIWFAGAASLYNREFYQLAKRRLSDDGILQQWIQMHHLSPVDILTIIASLRTEFDFVSLYMIGAQGILVASNSTSRRMPALLAIEKLENHAGLKDIRRIFGKEFSDIKNSLLLDPKGVDGFIAKYVVRPEWVASTDNNLTLEYSTPKGNVNDPVRSYEVNTSMLHEFSVR